MRSNSLDLEPEAIETDLMAARTHDEEIEIDDALVPPAVSHLGHSRRAFRVRASPVRSGRQGHLRRLPDAVVRPSQTPLGNVDFRESCPSEILATESGTYARLHRVWLY